MSLSFEIAIICYNSKKTIQSSVRRLFEVLPEDVPILIIDDGSTDGTSSVLKDCNVRVIIHSSNMGRAQARQTALDYSNADVWARLIILYAFT